MTEMPDRVCTAESILDYLTVRNPNVWSIDQLNATQSDDPRWRYPIYVEPWDEFNFETMEQIFSGDLMQECRDKRHKFHFLEPQLVPGAQDEDSGEPAASAILNLWTNTVVNKALIAVRDTLNPVQWAQQSSAARADVGEALLTLKRAQKGARAQPVRLAKAGVAQTKTRKGIVIPDGSGIAIPASHGSGIKGKLCIKPPSKLPKEIKPGSKWMSGKAIRKRRGEALEWINKNRSAPLRQIYEQCLQAKTRYGCIVTTKEAVFVRIGPYKGGSWPFGKSKSPPTQSQLAEAIGNNGVLEYKSIPWGIHRKDGQSLEKFRVMTMNLALWFLHILAGNNHELAWEYGPLAEEALRVNNPKLDNAASQVSQVTQGSQGQLVVEIPITSSFVSVAQSHIESQDIPAAGGHESMGYLASFTTESDPGDNVSKDGRRGKRQLHTDSDEAAPTPKRRGRGRPRKEA
ncbi:hypothetical protein F4859DRAFT_527892 [Xylaria cf. heliscus]|nr:hypothetical protein F4859DRAFT_527892 [Xylaria cf. heliscus]